MFNTKTGLESKSMENYKINIYGDSIMRGTVIDENKRYHSTIGGLLDWLNGCFGLIFKNKARFGITIDKGERILKNDLESGLDCDFALVEFGGNDCSFLWQEVGADPARDHQPFTRLDAFEETCLEMVTSIQRAGAEPVLMTLPPLDAEKHLAFISGEEDKKRRNILQWLGDVQMIYRFHELYSGTIVKIADRTGALLVDVRSRFLDKHNLRDLVGADGVHPTAKGYQLICDAFADFIAARRKQAIDKRAPLLALG